MSKIAASSPAATWGAAPPRTAQPKGIGDATPAMARFIEIKAEHPDHLLFYRMGDFYELFFEDAVKASAALNLTLTKRGQHKGEDIPMCGVPVRAAEGYLHRLVRQGFKIAICEQMEAVGEAKRRGGKAVIDRQVVRLVTAGTLTEDALLAPGEANYLLALARAAPAKSGEGALGLAAADLSTGDVILETLAADDLPGALAQLAPAEILVSERMIEAPDIGGHIALQTAATTIWPSAKFNPASGGRHIMSAYGIAALDALGALSAPEVSALGALVDYLETTQKSRVTALRPPRRLDSGTRLHIDAATRTNLELVAGAHGGKTTTLLAAIDRTKTAGGARLLRERLLAPLRTRAPIEGRLDAVDLFRERRDLRARLRRLLADLPDLARLVTRLSLGRGGPRDLLAIGEALTLAKALATAIEEDLARFPAIGAIGEVAAALELLRLDAALADMIVDIRSAIAEAPPLLARDGGFVRAGYSPPLDELHRLRDDSRSHIAGLEARYRGETGIGQIKIKHNSVLGYFIEVSSATGEKLLGETAFHHRQSLVGVMRFSTADLAALASAIESAGARALALELELFEGVVQRVLSAVARLQQIADALSLVDCLAALAELADSEEYVRPRIDESLTFRIEGGRHPVVEQQLRATMGARAFIANDCDLTGSEAAGSLSIVTGPNMGGKSTYLRQNALILLLAQMGSFVPARSAHIGLVDRLFSRVGASDDLARGRSTFMVEMVETAAILNQASERSFVILDEIGRGTATFDGLAIAWSVLEHLHDVTRCRGLFATHYHELTALKERLPRLAAATMRVREHRGDILFLHEVTAGTADRSYGVQVAKLAGLPKPVVARARALLGELERLRPQSLAIRLEDLPLFALAEDRAAPETRRTALDRLRAAIERLDPDKLSPRDALGALYELKEIAAMTDEGGDDEK